MQGIWNVIVKSQDLRDRIEAIVELAISQIWVSGSGSSPSFAKDPCDKCHLSKKYDVVTRTGGGHLKQQYGGEGEYIEILPMLDECQVARAHANSQMTWRAISKVTVHLISRAVRVYVPGEFACEKDNLSSCVSLDTKI